jgi:hypothetical protein
VIAALLRHLAIRIPEFSEEAMVWCTPLERQDGGSLLLLSAVARRQAVYQAGRLRAAGFGLIDAPAVWLDARTFSAVVPGWNLPFMADALVPFAAEDVEQVWASISERRYPIAAWVFLSLPGALVPASRAVALTRATTALVDDRPPSTSTFHTLAEMLRRTDPLAAGDFTSLELLPRLADRGKE